MKVGRTWEWRSQMAVSVYLERVIDELERNAQLVKEEELQAMADAILRAERVFVAGTGRTGFAARAFSNRLMQLGMTVYFVGEPTTPAIGMGDLLFVESGSGETASLVVMAKKARESGARVATVTIHPEASIGRLADRIICLPGATPKSGLEDTCSSVQVMASSFEQLGWIVGDVLIHYLMERTGITGDEMYKRHANLE